MARYQARAPEKKYIPAFEVEKLDGTYKKQLAKKTETGIKFEEVELPRGYLVSFPINKHSVHFPTYEALEAAGFADTSIPLLNDEGDVMDSKLNEGLIQKPKRAANVQS